ncbi:hypothetical protein AAFP35_03490 [Gordonia sp. CPCC 206044]|uniref:DUF7161 family protein n=1 Tax=Gordonia sp. CPCC 206044 TaxID=3140793 RepID=UPI003AF3F35B
MTDHRFTSHAHRYSLGIDRELGRHYISIPIIGDPVGFEEYYGIDEAVFDDLLADPERALRLAEQCRVRMHDRLLLYPPRSDRGTADVLGDPVPICYDQTDLAGRIAVALVDDLTDDTGWEVDLPTGTGRVVILDDTPNPHLTLRVHPVNEPSRVVLVDHSELGFTGR